MNAKIRITAGVLILALTSCSSGLEPALLWEATLDPVLPSPVSGTVAAVTDAGRTQIGIQIREAEPGVTYRWRVDTGTCEAAGQLQGGLASYPSLVPGSSGTASAEAIISAVFSSGSSYAARVAREENGGEVVVACGVLEER